LRKEVKEALHVDANAKFFSGDNGNGFVYVSTEKDVLPFYKEVIANKSMRILIY